MKHLYLLFFILLLSCKNNTVQENVSENKTEENKTIDLQKLYSNYHNEPKTQAQIDENLIIEYIADKELITDRKENGVYITIHEQGEGEFLSKDEIITAHYKGTLLDGTEFDNSYKREKPISFRIGQMIYGWNQSMQYLKHGSKATLLIPSHLAYQKRGYRDMIGPDEVLVFEIEIF